MRSIDAFKESFAGRCPDDRTPDQRCARDWCRREDSGGSTNGGEGDIHLELLDRPDRKRKTGAAATSETPPRRSLENLGQHDDSALLEQPTLPQLPGDRQRARLA